MEDLERLQALERDRGLMAMCQLQADSEEKGAAKLTAEEIDAEIRAARTERRTKKRR